MSRVLTHILMLLLIVGVTAPASAHYCMGCDSQTLVLADGNSADHQDRGSHGGAPGQAHLSTGCMAMCSPVAALTGDSIIAVFACDAALHPPPAGPLSGRCVEPDWRPPKA